MSLPTSHARDDTVRSPARSAPRAAVIGVVLVAAALLALALSGWLRRADTRATVGGPAPVEDVVTLRPDQLRAAGLEIEAVRAVDRADTLQAPAVLALDETRTARIGSMVEGVVVATLHDVGDRVGAGAALAELHSPDVHNAWADYRKATADRRRLVNELEFARQAEARATRLLADKAVSAQDLERAEADRVAAEQQLDVARTEVRRAEEHLEHLGVTNKEDPSGESGEQIPARTPVTGVVLERLVTPGTAVTPGTPLFVVSDLQSLWALAEVDETHLSSVGVGRAVQLTVAAYPDDRFGGAVTFVGDVVNPKTRRVMVRCRIPNPDNRLKPEMFATVILEAGEKRRVTVVPAAALHEVRGRISAFVEEAPGRFRVRAVTTAAEADGLVEVTSGLRPGDRVVTAGSFLVKSELLGAASPED